jgi:hypothetical protein
MACRVQSPPRDFQALARELEGMVARVKKTLDPRSRRCFLRKLRLLLDEADCLIVSGGEREGSGFDPGLSRRSTGRAGIRRVFESNAKTDSSRRKERWLGMTDI